jgi:hypothetical protein
MLLPKRQKINIVENNVKHHKPNQTKPTSSETE